MLFVAVTGGIGSGKSTVSAMLAARGAMLIDADAITRALQQPGTDVFTAIVDRFGDGVAAPDGTLDRRALAMLVFGGNDDEARADARAALEAIVHPAVGTETARRLQAVEGTAAVVVHDIPLLVESGTLEYAAVLVVDVDPEVAVRRLVEHRGFDEADARRRVASQASRAARLAVADRVLDNSGTVEELRDQVDAAWAWLTGLPHPPTERVRPS